MNTIAITKKVISILQYHPDTKNIIQKGNVYTTYHLAKDGTRMREVLYSITFECYNKSETRKEFYDRIEVTETKIILYNGTYKTLFTYDSWKDLLNI